MSRENDRDLDYHRIQASIEDALFLMDNGCCIEEAARRVGCSVNTLEKRMERDA
jgi:hypothetical protein